jgi:hypothetical protein
VPLTISDKQFAAVIALDAHARYAYSIKRIADWGEAWALFDDGWLSAEDDDGGTLFPLWPASRYADACREDEWSATSARMITLDHLLGHLLPGLSSEGHLVTVFPVPGKSNSVHADPLQLRKDLIAEYTKMGDDRE